MVFGCRENLSGCHERAAVHRYIAVAPWLFDDPVHAVIAVYVVRAEHSALQIAPALLSYVYIA